MTSTMQRPSTGSGNDGSGNGRPSTGSGNNGSGNPRLKPHKQKPRRTVGDWILLIAVIVVAVLVAVPFLIILVNSFKSPSDYANGGPLSLPTNIYLDGIASFWQRVNFPEKLWNSFFISGTVAVFAVIVSVFNAYAIGIGRVKGRVWVLVLFMIANTLPQEAMLYPLYFMFKQVGLYDNVWSVIIIFTVVQSAFGTYLLSAVFGTFPKEIIEAASLDGANRWQILRRVVVPISRPTLSVLLIFFFIWTWNEFLIPLTFLVSNANQTVPVAITALQGDRLMDVTTTSASALLGLIPTLIFFLIFQRTLTRGITAGSTK